MEDAASVFSAFIALILAIASYLGWRRRELRRDEVLAWGNRAIETMQTLALICLLDPTRRCTEKNQNDVDDAMFRTSVLIEQGRLLFKNIIRDDFGSDKPKAYRGYRPEILDHLVVAHQVACAWPASDQRQRHAMGELVVERLRRFVSAMQAEVGRGRTASEDTEAAGIGINLGLLLHQAENTPRGPRIHF